MHQHSAIVAQQEALARMAAALLGRSQRYSLVDFPDHPNVGDSAIWLGEIRVLRHQSGRLPDYVCSYANYSPEALDSAAPEGPILLHGGGNFGDLWPEHHALRLKILRDFPDRVVVQLPQSIHFDGDASETVSAIEAHRNFKLFVRDAESEDYAKGMFSCPVELAPDSAFGLGKIARSGKSDFDVMALIRSDKESAFHDFGQGLSGALVEDWLIERPVASWHKYEAAAKSFGRLASFKSRYRVNYYNALAKGRLRRGSDQLARGKVVLTDRLHAMILSVLQDIPVVALDNSYGKISRYANAWMAGLPKAIIARDPSEALAEARNLIT